MKKKKQLSKRAEGFLAIFTLAIFLVWCPVYLFVIRPVINKAIAPYISSYPAMLHLIPLLVLPFMVVALLVGVLALLFGYEMPQSKSSTRIGRR